MRHTLQKIALAAMLLAPFAASAAHAQSPTPENTVITNTATVTWTDANSNTYTQQQASVSVTVGFAAGIDVTGPATATPGSASTGNEITYVIANNGNGTDSVTVSTSAGAGLTITGYKIGSTTYSTLAELNAALAATSLAGTTGTVSVTVVYNVAPSLGGQNLPLSLTATSRRTNTVTDTQSTTVTPPATAGVSVTPDAGTVSRLPSNGTQYTATFTVNNTGNTAYTFNLGAAASSGAVISIVSVNGTAGASGSIAIAGSGTQTVDVVYTVANAAAGATSDLTLTATAQGNAAVTDNGKYTITVVRAAISITKEAYKDDATTLLTGTDKVLPGQYIRYKITVSNTGSAAASNVHVSDPLPSQLTFQSTADDGTAGWTLAQSSGTVTGDLTSLAGGASRFFWIRVQIK
ncbi:MAG: DUF11 domain-containing protein [Gemmatimonadetes bacterium]|nr:DUF11 domain-containing protein [Gemmatimonadota bacterium]